jgi:adenylate cyclase
LTDDIITTLSKMPRLFVISRSSTNVYKKKSATVQEASRDLGVRYILEGSIQKTGPRLRVNAQLLDGTSGVSVWAERYERDIGDLFDTRDQLLLDIASALAGTLTDGDVAKIVRRNTNSLEAWEALQRGHVYYERYNLKDNLLAREQYLKAVASDPKYVNAWMCVGWTHYMEGLLGKDEVRTDGFRKAMEIADKVVEMDPSYYGSYFLRGAVHLRQGRPEEAVLHGTKAAEIEPNNTHAVAMLAVELNYVGQPEKAILLFHRAMRLSPYYRTWYLDDLGVSYRLTGQNDKAIESWQKSIKRAPDSVSPHLGLAMIYAEQGRDAEMRAEVAEVLRIDPKFSIAARMKVRVYKDPKIIENSKELMRRAGLPE